MGRAGMKHRQRSEQVDVLIVCSPGGHLLEMLALESVWSTNARAWVTLPGEDARWILRGETVYFAHAPTIRSVTNLIRNLLLAVSLLRRLRPTLVLSNGAGVAVPFAWASRLVGIRYAYVECGGRVDRPSLSCRLIAPVTDTVFVQSEELVSKVRRSRYVGTIAPPVARLQALSEGDPSHDGPVFVTVGANDRYPFARLLHGAELLAATEPVSVQYGAGPQPRLERSVSFMHFEDLVANLKSASAVVTHAGIGSVLLALACGKRPVVIPRRRLYGESVDDHQVAFAALLASKGLAHVVTEVADLPAAVTAAQADRWQAPDNEQSALARELKSILDAGRPARTSRWLRLGLPHGPNAA